MKIIQCITRSQFNTFHHECIFLCLKWEDIFKYITLDLVMYILSKTMHKVKRFHECFLLVSNNPNFRVRLQGILRQLPDGSYASCELELATTLSNYIVTKVFHFLNAVHYN